MSQNLTVMVSAAMGTLAVAVCFSLLQRAAVCCSVLQVVMLCTQGLLVWSHFFVCVVCVESSLRMLGVC